MNPFRLLNDDISFDDISCNDISSNDAPMTPKPPRKLTFGNMLSTPRSSPKFGRKSPNKSKSGIVSYFIYNILKFNNVGHITVLTA